jgi:hypothetical protein
MHEQWAVCEYGCSLVAITWPIAGEAFSVTSGIGEEMK